MGILISILVILTCLLLMGVILIQNSKGGGLASNFSSSNQVMGVRRTSDFLEKATWTLAIVMLVLCLFSGALIDKNEGNTAPKSEIETLVNESPIAVPQNIGGPTAPEEE